MNGAQEEEDKIKSFEGTTFIRGDVVKVKGISKRATTYDFPNWHGPRIYNDVWLTIDYIVTSPEGSKYVSTKINNCGCYRFYIEDIEKII